MNQDVTRIWNDFQSELKNYILKRTRSKDATDDILQEVFLKIIIHKEKINQTENLQQYLYGMVKNVIADHYRKEKKLLPEEAIPEQVIEKESTDNLNEVIANCIRPFINNLDVKYKEALILSELDNIPQTELASRLNISYSGAKSRVQRGREKLKDQFLQCCHFEYDKYGNFLAMEKKDCRCD